MEVQVSTPDRVKIVITFFHLTRVSSKNKKQRCKFRECRMGCGMEITEGKGDTPGWEIYDEDVITNLAGKQTKVLRLKRKESHLKEASRPMLRSWRANCDMRLIVYEKSPSTVEPEDIAEISGYIVNYCTKGAVSYEKETELISSHILNVQSRYASDQKYELRSAVSKVLNRVCSSRTISKAEASVFLLNLDLYWFTESITHVPLSKKTIITLSESTKIKTKDKEKNMIFGYAHRSKQTIETRQQSLCQYINSMVRKSRLEYEEEIKDILKGKPNKMKMVQGKPKKKTDNDIDTELKETILDMNRIRRKKVRARDQVIYPTGLTAYACYPVSSHYAMGTLYMHKPWAANNRLLFEMNKDITPLQEFEHFIQSNSCPQSVKIKYFLAKHTHLKKRKLTNQDENVRMDASNLLDQRDNEWVNVVRDKHTTYIDPNPDMYQGADGKYDFTTRYTDLDPDVNDELWLENMEKLDIEAYGYAPKIEAINRTTQQPYKFDDVGDSEEQREIILKVLLKLKEYMEFPDKHKHDNSTTFEPLYMTIRGAGGTGKSHIIKILTNEIENMFPDARVTCTTAPTGNAAFSIGGRTCHSFFFNQQR